MTRRLHYPALLLACFAFGYWVVPSHAAPPKHGIGTAVIAINGKTYTLKAGNSGDIPPVPKAPCNLGNRMNVHIEEGWMYVCNCFVLSNGFHCQWDLVGQVSMASKKHPVIRIYPKPRVTA